jgi:hypothetical protein
MFGTRLINSTVVTAMMITFVLIMIVLFILFIKDIGRNIVSIIVIILGISMLIVMTGIKIYSKKQGTDNIKKAINDNYSNAENILIQFDRNTKNNKGYFTSEDKIFSFEIINNTLVIKNEETVVKYISGENY